MAKIGRTAEWATLVYLGVFQTGLAYVLLPSAMSHRPALEASLLLLLLLLEPVLNPVWTWLVRGENPGVWVWTGGAIIIGATAAKTIADYCRRGVAAGAGTSL